MLCSLPQKRRAGPTLGRKANVLALAAIVLGLPAAGDTLEDAQRACEHLQGFPRCHGLCVYYFQHDGVTSEYDGEFWDEAEGCHLVPEVVVLGHPPPDPISWPIWTTWQDLTPFYTYPSWLAHWSDDTGEEEDEPPPTPACSPQTHPDPGSNATYTIDVTQDLPIAGDGQWGQTLPTEPTDFTPWSFNAYCAKPETWKVRMKGNWRTAIRWGARLLDGVTQVTVQSMSAIEDCAELSRMHSDLGSIPPPVPKYYMKQAVEAHERLHVRRLVADFRRAFATTKSTLEQLSFPVSKHGTDKTEVLNDLSKSQNIKGAVDSFKDAYLDSVKIEGNHSRGGYDRAALVAMLPYRSMVARLKQARCPGGSDDGSPDDY